MKKSIVIAVINGAILLLLANDALGQKRIILPNKTGTAPTQQMIGSGNVIYPQNPVPTGGYGQATSVGSYPVGQMPVQMNPSPGGAGQNNGPLAIVNVPFSPLAPFGFLVVKQGQVKQQNPPFPGLNPFQPGPMKGGLGGGAGGGLCGGSGGY